MPLTANFIIASVSVIIVKDNHAHY